MRHKAVVSEKIPGVAFGTHDENLCDAFPAGEIYQRRRCIVRLQYSGFDVKISGKIQKLPDGVSVFRRQVGQVACFRNVDRETVRAEIVGNPSASPDQHCRRGLVGDVNQKTITQIAVELGVVSAKARDKKLSLDDMSGGVFSISNLGGIGGTYFTPIINAPEVAILGMSRSVMEPVWTGDSFEPRLMMPLSLSYDHRVIDGANAIRFLRWVCEAFEQPFLLSLEG